MRPLSSTYIQHTVVRPTITQAVALFAPAIAQATIGTPPLCLGCRLVSLTTLFTRQLSILKRRLSIALFTHYRSTPLSLNYRSGHHPICPAIAQVVVALPLHPLLTQISSSSHCYSSHVLYHLWFSCHRSNCRPICSPTTVAQVALPSLKSLPYSLTLSSVVPPSSCIIGCPLHS